MSPSEGFLGVKWGSETGEAARHLGIRCDRWVPWEGRQGFEACADEEHPIDALGRKANVRMFRRQNQNGLEGLELEFRDCDQRRDELAAAVTRALSLSRTDGPPYEMFYNGAAVRLDRLDGAHMCLLTVAGPRFGDAFVTYVLAQGLGNLSVGLRPR